MDKILDEIDPIGRFQKFSVFLISCLSSFSAATIYSTIFTTAEPKLFCHFDNETIVIDDKFKCDILSNKSLDLTKSCVYDKTFYGTTIINEWNLICDKKYLSNLTQTFYMIGNV
jgi:hypothetical protein